MNCSPPSSSVHGILQARILQESFPSLRDLPNLGIEPGSPALQADSLPPEPPGKPPSEEQAWTIVFNNWQKQVLLLGKLQAFFLLISFSSFILSTQIIAI